MIQCPNCKRLTLAETRVCPHCGEEIPPQPNLDGQVVRVIARKPPLRGFKDWAMATLGFLVGLLSPFLFGIGYILAGAFYFFCRDKSEPFVRGLGAGLLAIVVLMLGAFALCMYMVIRPG
jgi:ribosomal protein L24E